MRTQFAILLTSAAALHLGQQRRPEDDPNHVAMRGEDIAEQLRNGTCGEFVQAVGAHIRFPVPEERELKTRLDKMSADGDIDGGADALFDGLMDKYEECEANLKSATPE